MYWNIHLVTKNKRLKIADAATCANRTEHHFGNVAMARKNAHIVTWLNLDAHYMSLRDFLSWKRDNALKRPFQVIISVCDTRVTVGSYKCYINFVNVMISAHCVYGKLKMSQLIWNRHCMSAHKPSLVLRNAWKRGTWHVQLRKYLQ